MAISDNERNEFIRKCITDGMSLSKVQDALNSELGIHMTYMELRMLTSELAVSWEAQDKKREAAKPHSKPEPQPARETNAVADKTCMDDGAIPPEEDVDLPEDETAAPEGAAADDAADANAAPAATGATKVEISKLVRPGTAISGNVTFASGSHGEWYVDQMGRLGLALAEGSAKPTEDDIRKFQVELQKQLQGY